MFQQVRNGPPQRDSGEDAHKSQRAEMADVRETWCARRQNPADDEANHHEAEAD